MLSDQLNLMLAAKEKIRQAIIKKGVNVDANLPLKDYAEKIMQIKTSQEKIEPEIEKVTDFRTINEKQDKIENKSSKRRQK